MRESEAAHPFLGNGVLDHGNPLMKIGVLSDTHGDRLMTLRAVSLFESFRVERVIHCGDVGGAPIVALLADWPTHFVAGNMDPVDELRHTVEEAGQTFHGPIARLEWEGRRIAALHGDDHRAMHDLTREGVDLICSGHTHVADHRRADGVVMLNPGAIHRTRQPSIAIVELPSLGVTHVPLA
jgi:hypothetical protein